MSQTLNLIHLRPNLSQLLPWAVRHRLVAGKGHPDLGYAFHAAMSAVWQQNAPQPFSFRPHQGLLAYSAQSADSLRISASLATPEVAQMLGLDATPESAGLLIRSFPHAWQTGQLLGFDVRVRPTVRKNDKELDAFLSAVQRAPDAAPSREAVYRAWLERHLGTAAALREARMTEFCLTDVIRQGAPSEDGSRAKHTVSGPDAVFSGLLEVQDGTAFAQLVARGIGRHRAFGYGMLLLKPANPFGL